MSRPLFITVLSIALFMCFSMVKAQNHKNITHDASGSSTQKVSRGGDTASRNEYQRAKITIFHQGGGRTLGRLFMGFGINNALASRQSLGDQYKLFGSRFFEVGGELSTSVVRGDFLRINYGLGVQFNGLKPRHNTYFVAQAHQTILKEFPEKLSKSKLRTDYLILPVHLEIGPADIDRQPYSWRVGAGGFVGTLIGTRQTLKYKENGKKQKEKSARQMHVSDLAYGLSAYVGYEKLALYVKYNLNPLFKNNPIDEQNLSFGLRITFY